MNTFFEVLRKPLILKSSGVILALVVMFGIIAGIGYLSAFIDDGIKSASFLSVLITGCIIYFFFIVPAVGVLFFIYLYLPCKTIVRRIRLTMTMVYKQK